MSEENINHILTFNLTQILNNDMLIFPTICSNINKSSSPPPNKSYFPQNDIDNFFITIKISDYTILYNFVTCLSII